MGYAFLFSFLLLVPGILSRVPYKGSTIDLTDSTLPGWTRFMEWKYPVEVVMKNPSAYKGTGVVASL